MAQQLPLFQNLDRKKNKNRDTERQVVDELVFSLPFFQSGSQYFEMLDVVSRFPQYSIFNGFLLFIQQPAATMVATAAVWASKYGRQLKPDAQPLIILAPMSPVRFLFDIKDTIGTPVPPAGLKQREIGTVFRDRYENTVHNASLHGIAIRETMDDEKTFYRILRREPENRIIFHKHRVAEGLPLLILLQASDSMEVKYRHMAFALGEIFCGHRGSVQHNWWPDRSGQGAGERRLEAGSTAFLVLRRAGLPVEPTDFFTDELFREREIPPVIISGVFQAAQYIEDMANGLWKNPKKSGSKNPRGWADPLLQR